MSRWQMSLGSLALLVVALGTPLRSADQVLIPAGSAWKYNDSGTDLGTLWRAAGYNDIAWPTGTAQLGYGDGDESTVLSYGPSSTNRYITYYFRRSFTVADPTALASLTVRFVRDDGMVIYLNGVEVVRSNMPTGTVSYLTRATTAIGGTDESAWLESPIDPARLVAGDNVIAVELHQSAPSSTDVSFNLELKAAEAQVPGPAASLGSPSNHAVVNNAAITFGASVSAPGGLASATLYVGGPPKTVTFSGPAQIEDAQITADAPIVPDGANASINIDGQAPHAHGLLKVPALIGSGASQVPAGATITSATLQVSCSNPGNTMRLYRLTQSWVEDQATWQQRAAGSAWGSPGADGTGSHAGVSLPGDCTVIGQRTIDITLFVQEWSNGAANHGLVLIESGIDGIDFSSSESAAAPVLTVTYKSTQQAIQTKTLSGTTADVTFATSLATAQTHFWNVQVVDLAERIGWAPADFDLTIDVGAPDAPSLPSPADQATDVPTSSSLEAFVSDPGGGTLNVSVAMRQTSAPEFTIIALPDTQHYSEAFPAVFTSQTQWIVNNKQARNIVFVTHEGDIVEHYNLESEWIRANTSMSLLDGVVPYGMGPGNHDQPTGFYNQYFPYTRYEGLPWYGGHFQNLNDNNYQLFSGGGMDFVIVHLEFCPPAAAVAWASSVLQSHPDRIGIMTTHGYLNESAQRTVHGCANTQYLWDGLAVPNPNLHFMLSGHVHNESRRADILHGHPVFQMLADYQDRASGGEGWLRILRFVPADDRVHVQTYSPWLNRYETDANSEFTLDFPMAGAFATSGSTNAASGTRAAVPVSNLAANTDYEWRVTVTNAAGKSTTGPIWRFRTGSNGPINHAPSAQDQSAATSEDTARAITLAATDSDGDTLTYSILGNPAHGTLTGSGANRTYQPAANYNGPDSFTFRANDGRANSNVATVTIAVQAANDAPTATGESYGVQSGGTLAIAAPGVLGNDSDVDGGTLTAQLASGASSGTLVLNANGSFTYAPSSGFTGPVTFSYRANDGLTSSAAASVTINVTSAAPTGGLVAAYSFNEASGTTLADRSGRGHTGTISGATWSTQGRFGGALSFDGVNDWVTVADTAALDLTTGMTLEAWVNPSAVTNWRTVLMKQRTGGLAYSLYGANGSSRPAGFVYIGGERGATASGVLAVNTWTHLALTYNGVTLRIFVNGVQVGTRAQTGAISTSAQVLRIGGNSLWNEFFRGRIDEVRIYNRALSQAEIQIDMTTAINP